MKKFLAVVLTVTAIVFASCGYTAQEGTEVVADTITTDSLVVDTVKVDSVVRCVAITKAGTQCERLCDYPDTLCFQHKK